MVRPDLLLSPCQPLNYLLTRTTERDISCCLSARTQESRLLQGCHTHTPTPDPTRPDSTHRLHDLFSIHTSGHKLSPVPCRFALLSCPVQPCPVPCRTVLSVVFSVVRLEEEKEEKEEITDKVSLYLFFPGDWHKQKGPPVSRCLSLVCSVFTRLKFSSESWSTLWLSVGPCSLQSQAIAPPSHLYCLCTLTLEYCKESRSLPQSPPPII